MSQGYRVKGIGNRESGNLKSENGKLKDMINTTGEDALKLSIEGENKRLATGCCYASERQDGKQVAEGDLIRSKHSSVEQTLLRAKTKNTPFKKGGCQALPDRGILNSSLLTPNSSLLFNAGGIK